MSIEQVKMVCEVAGCDKPPARSGVRVMSKCLGHLLGGKKLLKPRRIGAGR